MNWLRAEARVFLAIPALTLALAGCDAQPGGDTPSADAPEPARALAAGAPVRGELTTQSAMNMNDGSRYEVFDLSLSPETPVRITLDSAFRGVLALYRDGVLVESGSPGGCCSQERRPATLVHKADGQGVYELAVSGVDHDGYGPFRLEAVTLEAVNSGPLPSGGEITGWLGRGTPVRGEHRSNVYDIEIQEAGIHEFTMRSHDMDSYLALRGQGIALEDDDGAGDLDARISAFLEPGRYNLRAGAMGGDGSGVYTVSSERRPLPDGVRIQNGGPIALGAEVMGHYSGAPLHYELTMSERRRVVIDMRSEHIDSVLELRGGDVALSDDDSGGNYDARIEAMLEPGTYSLDAGSMGGSGTFRLSVR